MQIKTTLRFHLTPLEWPESMVMTNPGEDMVKQEAIYTAGGKNLYNHYGKQYGDSSKN
jgi:hypothetical protein